MKRRFFVLLKEELWDLWRSYSVVWRVKSGRIRWAGKRGGDK
jgi:hypothetical protein